MAAIALPLYGTVHPPEPKGVVADYLEALSRGNLEEVLAMQDTGFTVHLFGGRSLKSPDEVRDAQEWRIATGTSFRVDSIHRLDEDHLDAFVTVRNRVWSALGARPHIRDRFILSRRFVWHELQALPENDPAHDQLCRFLDWVAGLQDPGRLDRIWDGRWLIRTPSSARDWVSLSAAYRSSKVNQPPVPSDRVRRRRGLCPMS